MWIIELSKNQNYLTTERIPMNWKSLSLTLIISMILFFGMVSMGMKYHWVDKINNNNNTQNVDLKIPQQVVNDEQTTHFQSKQPLDFKPVVLQHDLNNNHSSFSTMTKQQVIDYCTAHVQKSTLANEQMTLAIGDCVVTRYQDPYQEVNGEVSSTLNSNH